MNSNKPSNTLTIIGLIAGIIAILFSFIPCVGTIAIVPGLIGLILGVIAFLKAKDNGHPQGLAIAAIAVSVIACAISAYQIYSFGNLASDMKSEMKEYTNCDEIKVDYEKVKKEMTALTEEIEDGSSPLSSISKMTKLSVRLGNIQGQGKKMECDIDFDDFKPGDGVGEKDNDEAPLKTEDSSGSAEGEDN